MNKIDNELLHRFFRGDATDDELLFIKKSSDESDVYYQHLLRERKLFDLLSAQEVEMKEVSTPKPAPQKASLVSLFTQVAAAAAIVFLTILCYEELQSPSPEDIAYNTIEVPTGQRVDVILSDGTKVSLNSGSTLRYPTRFAEDTRSLHLQGEGYFNVAQDATKPFIVSTYAGSIEVLGTKFNLLADSLLHHYETTLFSGEVKVADKQGHEVILKPNQQVVYANSELLVSNIVDFERFEWRKGLISFRDLPFDLIMERFSEIYKVEIVNTNMSTNKYTFTGKFRYTDGVEYALKVLQKELDFSYSTDTENNVYYIK